MPEDRSEGIRKAGESVDQIMSVEITGRGVVKALYDAARKEQGGEPLALLAARRIIETGVGQGDVVLIGTGLPTYPWFTGEQDGPVGAATLARSLVLAFGARPVIVTDPVDVGLCEAALKGAGLNVRSVADMLRLPTTAAVVAISTDWGEARAQARDIFDSLNPKFIVTIERPGANEHGEYHSAGGRNFSAHCGKVDTLIEEARRRGVLSIGIGDGGNELGCAIIKDAVLEHVPVGKVCQCPCGGSVVPATPTDILVLACISNWGSYAIEACLASILGRMEALHSAAIDLRVHEVTAFAGANNNGPGLLDVGTDAMAPPVHHAYLELLRQITESSLDPGRLYRPNRYPWLYY